MECERFLEGYSDYLDGLTSADSAREFEQHLRICGRCQRYDRVMKQGLALCRDLPEVDAAPDFLPRLRHRIYHIEDGIPLATMRSGGSAALVAVAAVGLLALAWLPFATTVPVEVELPAVAARAPSPSPASHARRETDDVSFFSLPFGLPGTSSTSLFSGHGPFLAPASLHWGDGLKGLEGDFFASAGAGLSGRPSFLMAMEQRAAFAH